MSTNGMTSWAVDLANVGAIYPFQGLEVLFVIVGLAFWIGWHILQSRQETAEFDRDLDADPRGEETKNAIEGY